MTDRSVNILIKARDQASSVFARVGTSGQNLVRSLTSVRSLVAGGLGLAGISLGAAEAIKGYAAQQEAETRLRKSLQLLGGNIDGNLDAMKAYASRLQSVTTLADDAALNIQALAINAGATVPQAQRLTRAAVDMAAALGMDVNDAATQLTKTLSGTSGRLGQLIPELSSFTQEQLRAGKAIDLVGEKFRNAGDAAGSYERRWKQLLNSVGDLGEGVVSAISDSINKQGDGVERLLVQLREAVDETTNLVDMLNKANDARRQQGRLNTNSGVVKATMHAISPLSLGQYIANPLVERGLTAFGQPLQDQQMQQMRDAARKRTADVTSAGVDDIILNKISADAARMTRLGFGRSFGIETPTPENIARFQGNALAGFAKQLASSGMNAIQAGRDRLAGFGRGLLAQGKAQQEERAANTMMAAEQKMLELRARFGDEEARRQVELLRIREAFADAERELVALTEARYQSEESRVAAQQKLDDLRGKRLEAEAKVMAEDKRTGSLRAARSALAPLLEGMGLVGHGQNFQGRSMQADIAKAATATAANTKAAADSLADLARNAQRGSVVVGVLS